MFKLTAPCNNCPFRADVRPFLRRARARGIATSLLADKDFPCHKTTKFDDDNDEDGPVCDRYADGEQQCAGAMIMLVRVDRPNQAMRVGERLGIFDPARLNMQSPVYDNFQEFIDAQPL